ncbi:uncharacterized protein LOC144118317 [Amblyomma americanum]
MPNITNVHLNPNNFEKMKVNYAFHLFSSEVLRGLFLYREEISKSCTYREPTEQFITIMQKLISVMTSRVPSEALRKNSEEEAVLQNALDYISRWEANTGPTKAGFLSSSTAEGLRVTLKGTLELLTYLTECVGYKYLLTSRLSQDPLENLFGIIRQFSGCIDHPTSSQLLTAVNCLSFYNLVKALNTGNCAGDAITSLVGVNEAANHADTLIDKGKLDEASSVLDKSELGDHIYPQQTSDARLTYYLAGYVARKRVMGTKCPECFEQLLTTAEDADEANSTAAELAGLHLAADLLLLLPGQQPAVILTDSRAALQLLRQHQPRQHTVANLTARLMAIQDAGRPVSLQWLPSHVGITKNEAADQLAGAAHTNGSPVSSKVTQLDFARPALRQAVRALHPDPRVASGVRFMRVPDCLPRRERTLILRLRTGCSWTQARLHRHGRAPSPACSFCGADETLGHLLCSCPNLEAARRDMTAGYRNLGLPSYSDQDLLHPERSQTEAFRLLLEFLPSTGSATRL